jgi:hypothetical protein
MDAELRKLMDEELRLPPFLKKRTQDFALASATTWTAQRSVTVLCLCLLIVSLGRQMWLSDWKRWTEKYEITNQSVQGDKTKPDSTKLVTRASACGSS